MTPIPTPSPTPLGVPDLEFDYPPCTVCDDFGEMTYDAGFYCLACGAEWNDQGKNGVLDV